MSDNWSHWVRLSTWWPNRLWKYENFYTLDQAVVWNMTNISKNDFINFPSFIFPFHVYWYMTMNIEFYIYSIVEAIKSCKKNYSFKIMFFFIGGDRYSSIYNILKLKKKNHFFDFSIIKFSNTYNINIIAIPPTTAKTKKTRPGKKVIESW